ncbi:septal ring lytic transglycosylase RlpA family protein [Sphaerisporangium perillae]|uniref:septal ring lytic transglycosylase RlpA family protein n=1 Tax=Sphaerisporangium perillae TaxID=2935860 RepID=UPI00200E9247|nr:septal ring lytic transglycosylase RlpA family protein [Sphaerisporangium perillae]
MTVVVAAACAGAWVVVSGESTSTNSGPHPAARPITSGALSSTAGGAVQMTGAFGAFGTPGGFGTSRPSGPGSPAGAALSLLAPQAAGSTPPGTSPAPTPDRTASRTKAPSAVTAREGGPATAGTRTEAAGTTEGTASAPTKATKSANASKKKSASKEAKVIALGRCGASFYDEGQMTASGERFNPNAMTAAHKTLPMGSRVRVTNPANGKTVTVRINDRGPFVGGRCLDLSRAAFDAIGNLDTGAMTVKYAVLAR